MLTSVLIVDDDPVDLEAVRRTLMDCNQHICIHKANNGRAAEDFLKGRAWERDHMPKPGLILLDISMPHMDGVELLRKMRRDPGVPALPTIVLSSSTRPAEVRECFALGAAGYFEKPHQLAGLRRLIKCIHDYWARSEQQE